MNPTDNADLIGERDQLIGDMEMLDEKLQVILARLDEINQTLNPAAYTPQNTDYPRHGET